MRTTIIITAVAALVLTSCTNSSTTSEQKNDTSQAKQMSPDDMVKRGNYLVTVASCNDCHSPKKFTQMGPEVDSTKLLSGHPANTPIPPMDANVLKPGNWYQGSPDLTAWAGPWGISFTANLTPDSATGIGAWSEAVFIKTLRTGKHLGQENGRPILPPMPWNYIGQMTDEDLRSVYSYLRTLPAISNRVPAPLAPNEVKVK